MKIKLSLIIFLLLFANIAIALKPRYIPPKPSITHLGDAVYHNMLELKFVEGSGVRLRERGFVSLTGTDIGPVVALLNRYHDVNVERMFRDFPEEKLTQDKLNGEANTGWELADLNLWYICYLSENDDPIAFLNSLNNLDIVEVAYPSPIAESAAIRQDDVKLFDVMTPDFSDMQGYLYDAPPGLEAEYAWTFPGGRGAQMKWIDIEIGVRWTHEDIPAPFYQSGNQSDDHGTAVVGEVAGIDNESGITGIASDAQVGFIHYYGYPGNLAACFYEAFDHLHAGDVFLIELHAPGPNGNYICMEYWQANFDAIQTITANGVHCTQAAGNGGANYDDPIYEGRFDRNIRDSGAIICGAGDPQTLQRLWFSCYGSRLDSQGWGQDVVTTGGYCDLYGGGLDSCYTNSFSGTSSASPMITGSVLCVQGLLKARDEPLLSPLEMRALLTETGSPQPDTYQYIGTRPNLRAAFDTIVMPPGRVIEIPDDYPTIQQGIDASVDGDTVRVHPGTYAENINFNGHNVVVGSNLLFTGDATYILNTIIDGDSSGSVVTFENGESSESEITGFTLRNGFAPYGGGVYCDSSSPRIAYNLITVNSADSAGGGIALDVSDATIFSNVIYANSSGKGGGIYCSSFNEAVIINNTISGNISFRGGALYCGESSAPVLKNNILWADSASEEGFEIYVHETAAPAIEYCDIQGGWIGTGNIDIDPYFRDPDSADFHLSSIDCGDTLESPCIDTGHPAILDNILDCDWGLATELSDMGAFGGRDSITVGIVNPSLSSPVDFALAQNYPNPFNPTTTIRFDLPVGRWATLKIYDLLGREVMTVLDRPMPAGVHQVEFDGSSMASGVYFYLLKAGDFTASEKMILIK
jgi:serine protease